MKDFSRYRVKPGHRAHLASIAPDDSGPFTSKEAAAPRTEKLVNDLTGLQERLFAEGKRSLLIVLQGIDTAGKDGTIRHVMAGMNPQSCQVTSFKVPTPDESAHDFLWRIHTRVPAKGNIGIFNRSHYEDVIVTRVHDKITAGEARERFRQVNDFERLLAESGTTVVKFYLSISKDEQRRRLEARLDDPSKHWKFQFADVSERRYWSRYAKAFEETLSATSTADAPWYVIPANHKWYRNYLVAAILVSALQQMNPRYPPALKGVDVRKVKRQILSS